MRTFLAILALVVVFGLAGRVDASSADYTQPHPCPKGYVVKYEDDYCFDWTRHGNGRRGVYVGSHSTIHIVVVTPCGYAKLERQNKINWDRTPLLRGDMWAYYYGCRK